MTCQGLGAERDREVDCAGAEGASRVDRFQRSLICSMVNITRTLSYMEPKEQAAQLAEKRGVYMFKDAVDR